MDRSKYCSIICPRRLGPFNRVTYYTKWVKTSWTYSTKYWSITLSVPLHCKLYLPDCRWFVGIFFCKFDGKFEGSVLEGSIVGPEDDRVPQHYVVITRSSTHTWKKLVLANWQEIFCSVLGKPQKSSIFSRPATKALPPTLELSGQIFGGDFFELQKSSFS